MTCACVWVQNNDGPALPCTEMTRWANGAVRSPITRSTFKLMLMRLGLRVCRMGAAGRGFMVLPRYGFSHFSAAGLDSGQAKAGLRIVGLVAEPKPQVLA